MKFAIETIAYHEERMIGPFVKHYAPLVDKILLLNSTMPYYGENLNQVDNTVQIAKTWGATVLADHWNREEDQRNAGLRILSDYDWVFILDPDEFIQVEDFERIKTFLSGVTYPAYKVPMQKTYWKKGYCIDPPEPYRQLIAVRPKEIKFMDKRGINTEVLRIPFEFVLHHFSMARTDQEVLTKMTHFSHAMEFCGKEWFDEKWMKWTPDSTNFHPVNPTNWTKAIETGIPEEFKQLWEGL